jgi:hypothetical protein
LQVHLGRNREHKDSGMNSRPHSLGTMCSLAAKCLPFLFAYFESFAVKKVLDNLVKIAGVWALGRGAWLTDFDV